MPPPPADPAQRCRPCTARTTTPACWWSSRSAWPPACSPAPGSAAAWAIYALAGLGFYLVFGLSGQFAFSQGAFLGVAAYTSAWASRSLGFLGGFIAAVVVATVLALLLGGLVRRSSSFYFAIATLACRLHGGGALP